MHSHHHRTRTIHEWNDDNKNCWSRKSSLEKKLIILIIVMSVSTIGFLIFYTLTRPVIPAEICKTPGCSLAASEMLAHIDITIDPCEDFFKFTCGKLIEDNHGDIKAIEKLGVDALIENQLKEIIQEPISEDDHFLIKSQKQLFQACLNETTIEEESLAIFTETIEELNGWPVAVGYHWEAKQFDWQDMIYELRRRGYDYSMMLAVYVPNQLTEIDEYSVMIGEPSVESIKKEHKDLYINYMVDVAVIFGADKNFAIHEMKSVFEFMKKLEKIVDGSYSRQSDFDDEKSRTFTVEEFQRNHTKMDWLQFINTIISPLVNISGDDLVRFPNPEFLDKFFYLLYKTSKRTQANYIIWTVLQSVMPYMPKELKQLHANYSCTTGQQESPEERIDFCKKVVESSFIPGFAEITYARRYLSEETKANVEELFDYIKSTLSSYIMETTWMDEENKVNCSEKADNITATIGFDQDYFNDTIFESLLLPNDTFEDFGNDSFFKLLLNSKKRVVDAAYYQNFLPSNDSIMQLTMIASAINLYYSVPKNKLVLSPKILQGFYYNDHNPSYLNYGALGSEIGNSLMYGFEEELWTSETMEVKEEQSKCLAANIANFSNNKDNTTIAKPSLYNYIGIHLAYRAYQKFVEENSEEPQLPGIEYTPNQLFWISVILPRCYTSLEEDFLVGVILNNPKFSEDFSCSVDSRMNPSEDCELF